MRLTRTHFKMIAQVLAVHCASDEMIRDFANMLEGTNPRFRRDLFIRCAKGEFNVCN